MFGITDCIRREDLESDLLWWRKMSFEQVKKRLARWYFIHVMGTWCTVSVYAYFGNQKMYKVLRIVVWDCSLVRVPTFLSLVLLYHIYMRPIFSSVTKIGIFDLVFYFIAVNINHIALYIIIMNPFSKHIHSKIPSLIDKDALNIELDLFDEPCDFW